MLAVEDGYISRLRSNYTGYGKAIYLRTISGHEVVYAHLESFTPVLEKYGDFNKENERVI